MFIQAFGFVITLITRLFSFVFGIQLFDNLTFGGVIGGIFIATLAFKFITQFIGINYSFDTEPYKKAYSNSRKKTFTLKGDD